MDPAQPPNETPLHPALVNARKRNKADLLRLLEAVVAESPEKQAFLLHSEQHKAAHRVEAIRALERVNRRLRGDMVRLVFERDDLITRVPEGRQPEWLKERETKRTAAQERSKELKARGGRA